MFRNVGMEKVRLEYVSIVKMKKNEPESVVKEKMMESAVGHLKNLHG